MEVKKPDWGAVGDPNGGKMKATWLGHAGWLVETAARTSARTSTQEGDKCQARGVRILCDAVFAERTSPVKWAGPKRYTPPPCTVYDLPEIDCIITSHNHYDHLDIDTIKAVYLKQKGRLHIFCGLGNKPWYLSLGVGIRDEDVTELDWWDGVKFEVEKVGAVDIVCTPAQHFSARSILDRNKTLWCSWVFQEDSSVDSPRNSQSRTSRSLYFAGDTGYRHVSQAFPTAEEEAAQPACPAFADIGSVYGPFDLALLPIGLCAPRDFMSTVHCAPEDTVKVHKDLRSKRSIGMHYGTVRGGISAYFEDVRYPPKRWKECAEEVGLRWGEEVDLCAVGETVFVD